MLLFDPIFYENYYLDLKALKWNKEQLKNHYLLNGKKESRISSEKEFYEKFPEFDLHFYKSFYTDLSILNEDKYSLLRHYEYTGKKEGRLGRKIYGIYFICCMRNYLEVVEEQLQIVTSSGLYNITSKFLFFITLYNTDIEKIIQKYDLENKVIVVKSNENLYEKFAINNYKKYIDQNEKYYLYYFHTKGLSKMDDPKFYEYVSRRKLLNFYTLEKYKLNIKLLEKYDAVGCSMCLHPKTHFSGNYWWSKSEYMNTLPEKINDGYLSPEMYILTNDTCKAVSLSQNTNDILYEDYAFRNDEEIISQVTTVYFNNKDFKCLIWMC
jgi:hypothetical protein